jgi:hypothetical protein
MRSRLPQHRRQPVVAAGSQEAASASSRDRRGGRSVTAMMARDECSLTAAAAIVPEHFGVVFERHSIPGWRT